MSLGTNRTPFQCLARYQRSLNADILRKEWTAEEDGQLRAAVELYGEKDWQTVANALEGRAGTQCSNRSVTIFYVYPFLYELDKFRDSTVCWQFSLMILI